MLRIPSRRLDSCRRFISSNASISSPKKALPATGRLPPEKMRALVSLYHQADSFITPETLSAAIDAAFIESRKNEDSLNLGSSEESWAGLASKINAQRENPKISDADTTSSNVLYEKPVKTGLWSGLRTQRETEAMQTLFGVVDRGKPDVEVLEEEASRIQGRPQGDKLSEE